MHILCDLNDPESFLATTHQAKNCSHVSLMYIHIFIHVIVFGSCRFNRFIFYGNLLHESPLKDMAGTNDIPRSVRPSNRKKVFWCARSRFFRVTGTNRQTTLLILVYHTVVVSKKPFSTRQLRPDETRGIFFEPEVFKKPDWISDRLFNTNI